MFFIFTPFPSSLYHYTPFISLRVLIFPFFVFSLFTVQFFLAFFFPFLLTMKHLTLSILFQFMKQERYTRRVFMLNSVVVYLNLLTPIINFLTFLLFSFLLFDIKLQPRGVILYRHFVPFLHTLNPAFYFFSSIFLLYNLVFSLALVLTIFLISRSHIS